MNPSLVLAAVKEKLKYLGLTQNLLKSALFNSTGPNVFHICKTISDQYMNRIAQLNFWLHDVNGEIKLKDFRDGKYGKYLLKLIYN